MLNNILLNAHDPCDKVVLVSESLDLSKNGHSEKSPEQQKCKRVDSWWEEVSIIIGHIKSSLPNELSNTIAILVDSIG